MLQAAESMSQYDTEGILRLSQINKNVNLVPFSSEIAQNPKSTQIAMETHLAILGDVGRGTGDGTPSTWD